MIIDNELVFSKDQAITATAVSTNVVDIGIGDAGPSERLSLTIGMTTVFTGAGSIVATLQTSDASDFASLVALADYSLTNAMLKKPGKAVAQRLPHGCKRYLRINYTVTGTIADGKVLAALVLDVPAPQADPATINGI